MIFYIADLHLNHTNIMKHCNRPFKDVQEMNKTIIENWNNKVKTNDKVYILGDVCFVKRNENPKEIIKLLKELNGEKHLILGNHDNSILYDKEFKELFKSIKMYDKITDGDSKVVLFHYPIEEWDGFFRGTYHIHGHTHNSNNIMKINNRFNAGVDIHNYTPVTLKEMIEKNS